MDSAYVKMVQHVKEWDPFRFGPEFYETEASDVVQVVSEFDDPDYIAAKIQHIYFMSFEEVLDINKCKELAKQLLVIKETDRCQF
ncbi:DUF1871 family protein [Ectobacillus antri]|uniref:DUF1871 family protein n=1 Tax=Ectobacillus antri TaxID=2486280 RepID=A0ABT6H960_9BACI|nr:DUF1871 family protein [Ectobacillus antri]MDG4658276.1 DUF1871 family protein [Ectobacillus antri]MDG5755343.1 DUF1871 family protein [Ectobacillus antri]